MANYDVAKIMRVPSRIYVDGVQIGVTKAIRFMPNVKYAPITAEEFGHVAQKMILISQAPTVAMIIRDYDAAAFDALFPGSASGVVTGSVLNPKTASSMESKEVELKIVPLQSNAPGLIFYRAVPMLQESAELRYGYNSDIGVAAVFAALADASGKTHKISVASGLV